jgi:hypothetical protein
MELAGLEPGDLLGAIRRAWDQVSSFGHAQDRTDPLRSAQFRSVGDPGCYLETRLAHAGARLLVSYGVCKALRLFDVLPANPPFSPVRRSVDLRLSPGLVLPTRCPSSEPAAGAALLLVALCGSGSMVGQTSGSRPTRACPLGGRHACSHAKAKAPATV